MLLNNVTANEIVSFCCTFLPVKFDKMALRTVTLIVVTLYGAKQKKTKHCNRHFFIFGVNYLLFKIRRKLILILLYNIYHFNGSQIQIPNSVFTIHFCVTLLSYLSIIIVRGSWRSCFWHLISFNCKQPFRPSRAFSRASSYPAPMQTVLKNRVKYLLIYTTHMLRTRTENLSSNTNHYQIVLSLETKLCMMDYPQ